MRIMEATSRLAATVADPPRTWPRPPALLSRRAAILLTAIYAVWAALLLTNFDLQPLAHETFGLVFNDVARRLMRWDFTVSRDIISFEAFIRDGQSYAYFGILPAVLRMPLILLGGGSVEFARLSCLAAVILVVYFTIRTVQFACTMPDGRAHPFAAPAMLGMLLTGPPIYLLASASIYHEVIFWAAAFTVAFNAIVLHRFFAGEQLRSRDYTHLALLAGLCLLTRVNCGVALYTALFLLMLAELHAKRCKLVETATTFAVPCVIGAFFVAVQLVINEKHWGNPFSFAPWMYYGQYISDPSRIERLVRHGTFALIRVPYAIGYYTIGFKPESLNPAFYQDYYGSNEGPRIAALLCAPFIALCAVYGLVVLSSRRPLLRTPALLLAGNSIGPLIMLGTPFLAIRYTFDVWGTMLIAAALGLRAAARTMEHPSRTVRLGVVACLGIGILMSHLTLLRYKINAWSTAPAIRYSLSARIQPLLCPHARLTTSVKPTDSTPLVTPSCPPLW